MGLILFCPLSWKNNSSSHKYRNISVGEVDGIWEKDEGNVWAFFME